MEEISTYSPSLTALASALIAAACLPFVPAPEGLAWLPLALVLKLVMAHAVREEPYRPAVQA